MLRFFDGFDHYNSNADLLQKWSSGSVTGFQAGRFGGQSVYVNEQVDPVGFLYKILDNQTTFIAGVAFYAGANQQLISFWDNATQQYCLYHNNGTLNLYRNGAFVTSIAVVVPQGGWNYAEMKVTFHATTGSVYVRLNGTQVYAATNVNTAPSGNAYANKVGIGGTNAYWSSTSIDDVYVCDGQDGTASQGAANSDFLGAVPDGLVVKYVVPSGAGTNAQYTPSAGSNYQCVDDTPANGDTDYVSDGTVDHVDTYAMGNLPSYVGAVVAVTTVLNARKDDAGTRQIAPEFLISSTPYVGSTVTLTTTYVPYLEMVPENPATNAAWTKSDVDGAEFGVKTIA